MKRLFLFTLAVVLALTLSHLTKADGESGGALQLLTAEWAYDVRGEGDYDPNPTGVFSRSSRAYAYLEVNGFAVGESSEEPLVDLRVDVVLRSNKGLKLYSKDNLVEYTLARPAAVPDKVWFYIWVDVPWWAPRTTYRAEVIIRDLIGEVEMVTEREIVIE